MSKTYNKGEWSEIYAMFKLLGDKKMSAGDENLKKIPNLFYPILKILRTEKGINYNYVINDNIVIVNEDGKELVHKTVQDFLNEANLLFHIIKSSKGTFPAPEIEKFMDEIHCYKVKEKSQEKADIKIVIHDMRTGMTPSLGFSIKSQLGSNSTLLNSSKMTNFTYCIENIILSDANIKKINSIKTKKEVYDRVKEIMSLGGKLNFIETDDRVFNNNLMLIDSWLPEIIASLLVTCYTKETTRIKDLTEIMTKQNPMNYDITGNTHYYEHKIKELLVSTALGMVPHTVWNGQYQANGGYLVVKEDGDVLCYHIYDRNSFENFLYNNTKLESASIKKSKYAKIYKENNELRFKLNLQIRFK